MNDKKRVLAQALTVGDLREMIEGVNDDIPVMFSCSYGDYHNTLQVLPVSEALELTSGDLHESAYSQSGIAMLKEGRDDEDEGDDDEEDETPVLVLRTY